MNDMNKRYAEQAEVKELIYTDLDIHVRVF